MKIVKSYGCIVSSLTIDDKEEISCSEKTRNEVAKKLFDKFSDNYKFMERLAEVIIYKYGNYVDETGDVLLTLDKKHVFVLDEDENLFYDHKPCSPESTNVRELVSLLKERFDVNNDLNYLLSKITEDMYDECEVSEPCECCGDCVWTFKLTL